MKHIKHHSERLRLEIDNDCRSTLFMTNADLSVSSLSKPKNLSLFNVDKRKQAE